MTRLRWPLAILLSLGAALATLAVTLPDELSSEDKQALLDLHNQMRGQVAAGVVGDEPGAGDMELLLWDDGLAAVATDYAANCVFQHNPSGTRNAQFAAQSAISRVDLDDWNPDFVGENLYAVSFTNVDQDLLLDGVQAWFDEHAFYTFGTVDDGFGAGTEICEEDEQCGHYTQIVWAETRYVGCGFAVCGNLAPFGIEATYLVCNYFPAGNFIGEYPYQTSDTPCSACTADRDSACTDDLCSGCDFDDPLACLEVPVPEPARALQMIAALLVLAGLKAARRQEWHPC